MTSKDSHYQLKLGCDALNALLPHASIRNAAES